MFHVNVPDVLAYTVRLLRKAYQSGARTQVLMGEYDPQRLSAMLWALPDADFLPHAVHNPERFQTERSRTHLWLDVTSTAEPFCPVVVNLSTLEVGQGLTCELTKVIEVVGSQEAAVVAARNRWRVYASRGWSPQKHVGV
jgi:DNA polymerase IIIc chi subunit